MRIHRLSVSAFGPFASTQEIDFDALGDAGLFLIRGRTGAGKSSLLDAMCFALFGSIPRQRVAATGAKVASDHAPGQQPTVEMEFSVSARRLRIRRTGAYDALGRGGRPTTRRGTVLLQERRGGNWLEQASKEQETGEFIKRTLGLDLAQFVQLILLPQGEFAAFLKAKPDERGTLLERLFAIDRYREVEGWFADRKAATRLHRDERLREVDRCRDRIGEVLLTAGVATGVGDCAPAELPTATASLIDDLAAQAGAAQATADAAQSAAQIARQALVGAESREVRRAEAAQARAQLAALEAESSAHAARRVRLGAGRRAQLVEPLATAAARCAQRYSQSWQSVCAIDLSCVPSLVAPAESAVLPTATEIAGLDAAIARLDAALEDGTSTLAQLAGPAADADAARHRQSELTGQQDELITTAAAHQAALDALEHDHETISTQIQSLAPLLERRAAVESCSDTMHELALCASAVAKYGDEAMDAVQAAADASSQSVRLRAEVDRLRAARLAGIAAELGAELVDGQPCPVCGSPEHPKPATAAVGAATAGEIDRAQGLATAAATAAATAEATLAAARARLTEAEQRWTRAHDALPAWAQVTGWLAAADVAAAAGLWAERRPIAPESMQVVAAGFSRLTRESTDAATRAGQLDEHLSQLTAAQDRLRVRLAETRTDLAAVRARLADAAAAIVRAQELIETMSSRHSAGCPCTGSPDGHRRAADTITTLRTALTQLSGAAVAAREANDAFAAALILQEFTNEAEFGESLCTAVELDELTRLIADHDDAARAARAVLELPAVTAACHQPADDLPALRQAAGAAESAARDTRDAAVRLDRTVSRLRTLVTELGGLHSAYLKAETQLQTIGALADTINGTGEDNTRRMRLSAYVLAARLEAVTRFANERLGAMSDGRFTLEHSDARAKRGVRSGLGLVVRDAWTGQSRDTATLSGGESFMASLSLALGLGDAVLAEIGGRPLETLLVDEGFGSLDEDTLERVLEVLDDLRAGDRVVGIVSHVPDLRQRIPMQLAVHRGEAGSTVEIHAGSSTA